MSSDEEDFWQQTAPFGRSDGASRRRAGAHSKEVLAPVRGRDFCEDGVGDDEESYMSAHSSESSFVGDNLDEAEQINGCGSAPSR